MSYTKIQKLAVIPLLLILLHGCVITVDPDSWGWVDGYDDRHDHGHRHHIEKVFGSVYIDEGENVGDVESVNGSVTLNNNSSADRIEVVNGSVRIHDDVSVLSVKTVNGSIRAGDNFTVDGDVTTVNGRIELRTGTVVKDDVRTVNGAIYLRATEVGNNVETVNGDIKILRGSVISGDVVFEKNGGFNWHLTVPLLVVDSESAIKGTIHLYRRVDLEIDEGADVGEVVEHF